MALFDKRHGRGKPGPHASKGVAKSSGAATFGVSSEAEMAAKAPIGPKIANNHISNPTFSADGAYPAAQNSHAQDKSALNGRGSTDKNTILPQYWNHYCSLYTGTGQNYDTLLNNYFLRNRKFATDYRDQAAEISASYARGNNNDNQYEIGENQDRVLGLYGNSGYINSRNNDADRKHGDIPLYGHSTAVPDGDTTLADGEGWVKHSYYQIVNVPSGAQGCRFGAYVQCPSFDAFNTKNFAAIEIVQALDATNDPLNNANHTRVVRADAITFSNSAHNLPATLTTPFYTKTGDDAKFNFTGIAPSQSGDYPAYPNDFLWPSEIVAFGSAALDLGGVKGAASGQSDSDYRDFKLVDRVFGGSGQFILNENNNAAYSTLKFELSFYENTANITSAVGSTGSGSVRFYCPFIQFYKNGVNVSDYADDNNIIPTTASLRVAHTGYGSGRVIINGVNYNYDGGLTTIKTDLFDINNATINVRFVAIGVDAIFDGEPTVSGATLSGDTFDEEESADVTIIWDRTSSNVDITTDGLKD